MHELITPTQMQACDRAAVSQGICGLTLMERAGWAVADAVGAFHNPPARVAILCGPGNNGGDGFVAARHLAAQGYAIRLGLLGERAALTGDAAEMARRWSGPIETISPGLLDRADIIVDALFGAGLSRPLDGVARQVIEAIASSPAKVVAVDVPSGVDGATGAVLGAAPKADVTVTFFRAKPGHYLMPGRALVGRLIVADIGVSAAVLIPLAVATFLNGPSLWGGLFPTPSAGTHKYRRGHAVVLSGPAHRTGAARLAARAALRIGAGLVTVASPPDAVAVNAARLTAVMVEPVAEASALARLLGDARKNVCLLGPGAGIGEATRRNVLTALESKAAVVLDADALTMFAGKPELLFQPIKVRSAPVVLTPHEGEFSRLFPDVAGDKLARARAAAHRSGAVLVLKGPDTVIVAPNGRAAINANAPPWLATAGSGDVLAGLVTGLLAAGMPAFDAATAATWVHGAAACEIGPGLIAEDLPEVIPHVLRDLMSGLSSAHRD